MPGHLLLLIGLLTIGSFVSFVNGAFYPASCTVLATGNDDAARLVQFVKTCSTTLIPQHTTLNIKTRMNMTGIRDKHIVLQGKIVFEADIAYWIENGFPITFQNQITYWLLGGENIRLDGGGTIDGNGQAWYDAFASNASLLRPITLTVSEASNVIIEDITMLNSPEWFNLITEGQDITYNRINISAISTSSSFIANTDGWDIYRSNNVVIHDSVINNGDDCVSFKPNTTNVFISNLQCNGSHGISVGSLGQYAGIFDIVENITSTNVKMSNAENGARIKAFAGANVGSGIVKNITFSHFMESNVDNPLIIDQCYETSATDCAAFPSNVYIQDVIFNEISGTSSGNEKSVVASLDCSPDSRCNDISVNNLNLSAPAKVGNASFTCQNVVLSGNSASLFGECVST